MSAEPVPKVVRLENMDEHEVIWLFFFGLFINI